MKNTINKIVLFLLSPIVDSASTTAEFRKAEKKYYEKKIENALLSLRKDDYESYRHDMLVLKSLGKEIGKSL